MRPIEVSMTTVGPFGTASAVGVASGASGRSRAGLTADAGGVGLDCDDEIVAHARTRPHAKSEFRNLIPSKRVNHAA